MTSRWGILWRSENRLDGKRQYFLWDGTLPLLFRSRADAREYISDRFGYIAERPDLRREPHGWKMPSPIKVDVHIKSEALMSWRGNHHPDPDPRYKQIAMAMVIGFCSAAWLAAWLIFKRIAG